MKLFTFLFSIIAVGFIAASCDNRFEFLADVNQPPVIYFNNQSSVVTINDSLKTSLKHGKKSIDFTLNFSDPENQVAAVNFTMTSGQGLLLQDGNQINGSINTSKGFANLSFTPGQNGAGPVTIQFTVVDGFGKTSKCTFNCLVFDNLLPVASFQESLLGVNSTYEYQFDASASKDPDASQGGGIQAYHYVINGKFDIWTTSRTIRYVFAGSGGQEVDLYVVDNDGGTSPIFKKIITVK